MTFQTVGRLGDNTWLAAAVDMPAHPLRLPDGNGHKAIDIAGSRLRQLPERSRRHGVRIDEAAGAGAVDDEDDRRLTAQIDSTHGIAVIEDVRGVVAVL